MSVIVKGLSMPTACQFCPLVRFYRNVPNVWCNGTNKRLMTDYDGDPDVYIERPGWCPLVELPVKHGPMIDCQALLEEARRLSGPFVGDGWSDQGVFALIARQPTIVEAEE